MPRIVKTVCSHDCPDACSVLVTVEDDGGNPGGAQAVQFRGDPEHPVTRGFLCGKVNTYEQIVYSSERVLHPLRRCGPKGEGSFERVSWEEAVSVIAERINIVSRESGGESLLQYTYAGTMGLVNRNCPNALFNRLGATRLRQNICCSGADEGYRVTVGSGYGVDPEDTVHSDLIIVWGANVVTTQVHLMPFLDEARKKGARMIVIDPYRNRTARVADQWLGIRPGTDAALALALMHILERDGLLNRDFIERRTTGFKRLSREVLPRFEPARAAKLTGLSEEDIESLARELAGASAPLIKVGIGIGRSTRGGGAVRAICSLAGFTGSYEALGGGVQYDTGSEFHLELDSINRPDWLEGEPRSLNMTDIGPALCDWQDPPIRFLYVHGTNPAATAPLQAQVHAGLAREDLFTVVHERFLTDTARYADIVLPAPTFAEYADLYKAYGHLYLQYAEPAIAPLGESRCNLEVVQALAKELGYDDPWFNLNTRAHARALLSGSHPNLEGLDPESILAGEITRLNIPRKTCGFGERFETPSGKLEFYSSELEAQGLAPLVDYAEPEEEEDLERYPLRLITPPAHSFLNSSFGNLEKARRREGGGPFLMIHPDDAGELVDGDLVEISNRQGSVRLSARVTTDTNKGTVVAEGTWWPSHGLEGRGINLLTSNRLTDLGGGSTFHDSRVELKKI
ncbi:MAG: molybdopterin oxidoreductase family protein [Planctomycetota bacterium]